MARSLNRVTLIGNLGADPELRTTTSGSKVASINIATSESYKDKSGETVEQTEWHRVVLWNWLADIADKYTKKGSKVYVEGKLKTRNYEDKDGVTRYITEIVASDLLFLTPKDSSTNYSSEASDSLAMDNSQIDEGDVPF
ncbi:single-stranded DNA-binding protein [Bacteroidota bacterium]